MTIIDPFLCSHRIRILYRCDQASTDLTWAPSDQYLDARTVCADGLPLHRSVAGFLLQKELDYLDGAVKEPKRPFVAIVGGSKVSSKIGVIESLLAKADKVIIV